MIIAGLAGLDALGASPFAEAIARQEGYYQAGTLAQRNNNPGNLRWSPDRFCQRGSSGGFVTFCSLDDGWSALEHQIAVNAERGLTLYEFFAGKPGIYAGYAPAADRNRPRQYAENVAGWLGVDPNALTADIYSGAPARPAPLEPAPFFAGFPDGWWHNAPDVRLTDVPQWLPLAAAAAVVYLVS